MKNKKTDPKYTDLLALLDRNKCFSVVAGVVKEIVADAVVDLKSPEVKTQKPLATMLLCLCIHICYFQVASRSFTFDMHTYCFSASFDNPEYPAWRCMLIDHVAVEPFFLLLVVSPHQSLCLLTRLFKSSAGRIHRGVTCFGDAQRVTSGCRFSSSTQSLHFKAKALC